MIQRPFTTYRATYATSTAIQTNQFSIHRRFSMYWATRLTAVVEASASCVVEPVNVSTNVSVAVPTTAARTSDTIARLGVEEAKPAAGRRRTHAIQPCTPSTR